MALEKQTFVFWVNGDATDHFEPRQTELGSARDFGRIDAVHAKEIESVAQRCQSCNVVLLHDPRGTGRWYLPKKRWNAQFRAYSGGKLISKSSHKEVNGTNPENLASLLQYAEGEFPGTEIILIYVGHSFFPDFEPSQEGQGIRVFDLSHPQGSFGVEKFALGLEKARLKRPLASVILAGCEMSFLGIADRLKPYARNLVASQVPVLQTLNTRFDFTRIPEIVSEARDSSDPSEVTREIARHLMDRFENASNETEALMEYPVTLIHLDALGDAHRRMVALLSRISTRAEKRAAFQKAAGIAKVYSDRRVEALRAAGKSERMIEQSIQLVRVPSQIPGNWDAVRVLEKIEADGSESEESRSEARRLRLALKGSIEVFGTPRHSRKSGLSVLVP